MTTFIVLTEELSSGGNDGVRRVKFDGSALSLESSVRLEDPANTGAYQGQLSPDGKHIAIASTQGGVSTEGGATLLILDTETLAVVATANRATKSADASWSSDGARVALSHNRDVDGSLTLYSWDGTTLTELDRYDNGISNNFHSVGIDPTANKILHGLSGVVELLEFPSDVLARLDTDTIGNDVNNGISYSPTGAYVAAQGGPTLQVLGVSGSTIVAVDAFSTSAGRSKWSDDESRIYSGQHVLDFDGSTLTSAGQPQESGKQVGVSSDGQYLLWSVGSVVHLHDASTFAEITSLDLGQNVEEIWGLRGGPGGPTTPEEKFNASYADASAADPKVTALIRPADVQRSIDTDVSNLAGGPNLYVVEAIFDIGELQNLNPYNPTTEKPRVFFVKDDQPGLRQGKNLLLKGYTIRDADPSVPVTCTFWGP